MLEVWSLGPTACSEPVSLPKCSHSHFIHWYEAVCPAPWTQQHISHSCPPRWALIVYCKAIGSLPGHTNPRGPKQPGLLAYMGHGHSCSRHGNTTCCPEVGLNQKHVDRALYGPNMKSRWDKCWPSPRLSSDVACSPLVLHKMYLWEGMQRGVPTFIFAQLCLLCQTKMEPKGKGNHSAPSEFAACVHANR